jgi:molybdopterin-guanine dinucleotide biosynthesis protein A
MPGDKETAGYILAGGESSRMGRAKALLEILGEPLVLRAARLLESVVGTATVVGGNGRYQPLGLRSIEDDWPGAGPLGAIATALRASEARWNLILACDLPYLTADWLQYLAGRAALAAAAPETAGASLLILGAVAGGAGSGILVGDGLSKN